MVYMEYKDAKYFFFFPSESSLYTFDVLGHRMSQLSWSLSGIWKAAENLRPLR